MIDSNYNNNEIITLGGDENEENKNNSKFKKLINLFKNEKKKILVGFLIINVAMPLYLSYNSPSSMVKIFHENYEINADKFGRLYSVFAIPTIFMVFISGILIDLFGINKCAIIFSSLLTLSTILAALSTSNSSNSSNYNLLLFSRILLGIGGESLLICESCYIAKWFDEKHQSIVFGIEGSWVQVGSIIAFLVLPTLYEKTNFQTTLWFISIIGIASFILLILFIIFQSKLKFKKEEEEDNEDLIVQVTDDGAESSDDNIKIKNNNNISKFELLKLNFKQAVLIVKSMPIRMWILCLVSFFGYSAFFGLDIIFVDMAIEKYGYSDTKASFIIAFETIFISISSPIFGYIIKVLKRNIFCIGLAILMMLIAMVLIVLTPISVNPVLFIIINGFGYIFMSNGIFSSVPIIVEPSSQGTGYGLIAASYSIGIVLFPYILTCIRMSTGSYFYSIWVLIASSFCGIICCFILKYFDKNESNRLDRNNYTIFK